MDKHDEKANAAASNKRGLWQLLVVVLLAVGIAVWAGDRTAVTPPLPDLLGKAQAPLPKGALQIQDLQADPKGYTGSIVVRGVVAKVSPNDSQLFALIDSREARVCRDLDCAKFYMPMKAKEANLKPWDELNVRGTITEDAGKRLVYLSADSVENLGSIK